MPETAFVVEQVAPASLKPHPENYQTHPDDQLAHLAQSLKQYGVTRNLIIAQDDVILAGHGVVEAAKRAGLSHLPAVRMPFLHTDVRAKKLLIADNELSRMADRDDRKLTELLHTLDPADLLGTGFDAMKLATLLFVTRPSSEIERFDEAAAWAGMPDFDPYQLPYKLVVNFETDADRLAFVKQQEIKLRNQREGSPTWSTVWPWKERQKLTEQTFVKASLTS